MSRTFDKLREYWTVKPPVYLKRQPNFNGITVTPLHNEKKILMPRYDDEFVSITPIHEEKQVGSIQRTFGDLLAEEVMA